MGDGWVVRALTRKVHRSETRGNKHIVIVEPNMKLVYAVKFSLAMTGCLCCLQVAHMAFLHAWNSEIFVGISSLITFVSGVIVGQKAS
jgi:hypothetical protein